MAFGSLDELTDTIEDYLDRADLRPRLPTLIRLAELRLERRLNLSDNETTLALPIVAGTSPLPDDFKAWRAVYGPNGESYDYLSPHAFAAAFGNSRPAGCGAGFFTILGSVPLDDVDASVEEWTFGSGNAFIRVAPAAAVTLVYRQGVLPLGAERPSNWLLAKHPDLYLYGTLLEAEPYMRSDARIGLWRAMLEEAIADVVGLDRDARWGRARMTMSGPTP